MLFSDVQRWVRQTARFFLLLLLVRGVANVEDKLPPILDIVPEQLAAQAGRLLLKQTGSQAAQKDASPSAALSGYFSNQELADYLQQYTERCGHISRLFSIGKSVEGRELLVLEISDKPGKREAEPNFKYVGNMHGDEPTGRQLQLALADWLCANYKISDHAKRVVRDMHLFLLLTMNPDGFEHNTRGNIRHVDLNRNFPDRLQRPDGNLSAAGTEEAETLAIMHWSKRTKFVASASMHEGALVANYPYDGTQDMSRRYEPCPDDAAFKYLASTYAKHHGTMANSMEFPGGITNGAHWYPLMGGMQDWNYLAAGCMEVTLELSEAKFPPAEQLPQLFEDNLSALLALPLAAAFSGLRGVVTRQLTSGLRGNQAGPPLPALIQVHGISHSVRARKRFGDYYRPLAPGQYLVSATLPGCTDAIANITIPSDGSGLVQNFVLACKHRDGSQNLQAQNGDSTGLVKSSLLDDGLEESAGESPSLDPLVPLMDGRIVDRSSATGGGPKLGLVTHSGQYLKWSALLVVVFVVVIQVSMWYMRRQHRLHKRTARTA